MTKRLFLPQDKDGLKKRQLAQMSTSLPAGVMNNNDSTNNHRWYAIHVRHRQEKTTSMVLREKGYREFLPTYKTRRRWRDRIAELELPLFPGYIFCNVDLNDRRTPILTTPGVIRFI